MTTFVMLTIVLAGLAALSRLPVNDLPTIEHPHIQIMAGYTGASSETVLNQVTIPLEKELTHVKGVEEMTSKSSPGMTNISLSFDLSKDMGEAVRDVQAALNRAEPRLPKNLEPRPSYELQQDSRDPIMWFMLTSDQQTVGELRSYADAFILPRLSRLEGVAQIIVYGAKKSIWLRLNPEIMAARRIGFNEVMDTIRQHTSQMPLGTIQTSVKRLSIELAGTIHEAKELENLKIGNTPIRIKDIGEVSEKADQEREFHFVTPEKSSIALILGVQKVSDGNTVAIAKSVRNVLDSVAQSLPPTLKLHLWFDKSIWIEDSLHDVQWSLVFSFILVVLVIYFSLGRIAESMITSAALPLSLVGTCIIMYLAHFSLDLLSLLALTLAVGFVVDDAIVVLENIVRWQEKGKNAREASLIGSKQICFTILSMTLSLVAVFIPLLFMSGTNGRLFREFSITLAVAILVSGFISLSLTPMLCSRFLTAHRGQNKLQSAIDNANAWAVGLYGRTLKTCLQYPKTILMFALFCVAATGLLFSKLPVNLIPPEDRGFFFTIVNLPTGIDAPSIGAQQKKLDQLVQKNKSIDSFLSLNFDGNLLYIVRLYPFSQRPPQQQVIGEIQKLMDTIPGTLTFIQPYQLINLDIDFGNAGQYELIVRGLDFETVEKATNDLTNILKTHPEVTFAQHSLKHDAPMLTLRINNDLAHKLGFDQQKLQGLLQNAFGQGSVGTLQKGAEQENIYMELLPQFQNYTDAPSSLYLTTASGSFVPFKSLATWEEKLGSPDLVRREQLPAASIRFSLADSIAPNKGLELVENIAHNNLPGDTSGNLAGSAKQISSTIRDTLLLLLAAAVVMYIVLGILYESFVHPLTILSSIPFAGLGGILTLFLFGEPLSIFSAVGFLLLIGIVKKNGIMMVDYAIEAQKEGCPAIQAIYDACLVRFRPIMMTTIAAVMGAVPIAIGFGDGAEMRRGLGLVIVGGLLFSQVLTLFVTPIIYLTFEKLAKRVRTGDNSQELQNS